MGRGMDVDGRTCISLYFLWRVPVDHDEGEGEIARGRAESFFK